jgi:hypothetical protein
MEPAKESGLRERWSRNRVAAQFAAVVLPLAGALALSPLARGHVTAVQSVLQARSESRLRLDVPNERRDRPMTMLTVIVPGDMELLRGEPLGAWQPTLDGRTVVWRGGSLRPLQTAVFALWVVAPHRAGGAELDAEQGYADGRRVRWRVELDVTPAPGPEQRLGAAALVALAGVALVLAGSLVVLRRTRRRTLQER